jgi:hypothetical protein
MKDLLRSKAKGMETFAALLAKQQFKKNPFSTSYKPINLLKSFMEISEALSKY